MYKHILIPTDGSELSARTIEAGIELAKVTGARVTGLFVAPPNTPIVYRGLVPVGYTPPDKHARLIERISRRYLGVIEKAAAAAGVSCQCLSITGDFPAEAILQVAAKNKCDLIFMASHGARGVSALILGSEVQKVLTHSQLPVFVYR